MIYAVGDVHGSLDKLQQLIDFILDEKAADDTIVFLGDYIDRGPDSKGVVDLIIELQSKHEVVTLRGNHEQMALDAYEFFHRQESSRVSQDMSVMWFYNGADSTLKSYSATGSWWERIPAPHWNFLKSTLLIYESGGYCFVHAGLVPKGVTWHEDEYDSRLWIRDPFLYSKQDFGKVVVFGHTPHQEPLIMANKIGIDTGAVFGGPLTCVVLNPEIPYDPREVRLIQVK